MRSGDAAIIEAGLVKKSRAYINLCAYKLAARYGLTHDMCEDLRQEGAMHFIIALRRHDPSVLDAATPYTYASHRIIGAMLDYLIAYGSKIRVPEGGFAEFIEDEISDNQSYDPAYILQKKQEYARLHGCIEGLPQKWQHVLKSIYYDGMTARSVADQLGIDESRVCQIRKQAYKKLKGLMQ